MCSINIRSGQNLHFFGDELHEFASDDVLLGELKRIYAILPTITITEEIKDRLETRPTVDVSLRCGDAVTFEQRIRVRAHIEEFENRLRIAYQIFDAKTGKRTTTGYTIQVAVEETSREMCFVSPAILFERMGVTP